MHQRQVQHRQNYSQGPSLRILHNENGPDGKLKFTH